MPQQTVPIIFLQMAFTSPNGGEFPTSLWYLQSIQEDNNLAGGGAGVSWYGYADTAHAATGSDPVGVIHDSIAALEWLAVVSQQTTPGISRAADSAQAFAALAKSHKTQQAKNADGTVQTDGQGQPVMVSPFETATVVVLPVTVGTP